jgi:hypothetical protein
VATIMDIFSGTASACTTDSRHSYNHFWKFVKFKPLLIRRS